MSECHSLITSRLFLKMGTMLKAEATEGLVKAYNIFLTDMNLTWRVNLRNSVLEVVRILDGERVGQEKEEKVEGKEQKKLFGDGMLYILFH